MEALLPERGRETRGAAAVPREQVGEARARRRRVADLRVRADGLERGGRRGVLGPVRLDAVGERQRPRVDVVEAVRLLRRILADRVVVRLGPPDFLQERLLERRLAIEERPKQTLLRLGREDDVRARVEAAPRRRVGAQIVRGRRREGSGRAVDLDLMLPQHADQIGRARRVLAGDQHELLHRFPGDRRHRRRAEVVERVEASLAVVGRGDERRHGTGEVMEYRVGERGDAAVGQAVGEALAAAAVGLERHAGGAVERRVAVPVARVVQVVDLAREVRPAVAVERRGDVLPVGLDPPPRGLVELRVDRPGPRREEEAVRVAVVIDEEHGVPAVQLADDRLGLHLAQEHPVPVEIDLVMVVVRVHAPVAPMLLGGRVGIAHRRRAHPRHVARVALGVVRRVDDSDDVVEHPPGGGVGAGGEVVRQLDTRFERGRLVAVVREVHPGGRHGESPGARSPAAARRRSGSPRAAGCYRARSPPPG